MMTMTLTNREWNTSDDDVDHGGIVPDHYHDNHIAEIADNDGDILWQVTTPPSPGLVLGPEMLIWGGAGPINKIIAINNKIIIVLKMNNVTNNMKHWTVPSPENHHTAHHLQDQLQVDLFPTASCLPSVSSR